VLESAGATIPARDGVDRRVVGEVSAGTGRIVDSVADAGGWPQE
jgi:pectate lyase